jgi:hypothetical protein
MSPVGRGVLSLTKFYRLPQLVTELARIAPGMTSSQVRAPLGSGHGELANDLILYFDDVVIDDPLLQGCRAGSPSARALIWIALVMADHRLAQIVETFLTSSRGKLISNRFNADRLEEALQALLPGRATRKVATNILSYFHDSGLVEPRRQGNTIVGISRTNPTAPFVRDAVRYIIFRLQHLEIPYAVDGDDADAALAIKANHWLNLTQEEFRTAYDVTPADVTAEPPVPPRLPAGAIPPPVVAEVEVEAHNTESYEVSGQTTRTAVRREQPLVIAYQQYMEAQGCEIVRFRFRPPGTPAHLYSDLYNKTRNHLVEGKADASRPSIRMAIGQLMDYKRFAPVGVRLAVLTERRPHRDLEVLLDSVQIACIWRGGGGFVDNVEGAFV